MLMKHGGYDSAYNAQAAVDAESGVIVAATLTHVAPDMGHLPELVTEVRALRAAVERPDEEPTTVSADAGYFSGDNAAADGRGIDLLIAAGRDDPAAAASGAGGVFAADRFGYDAARDVWVCPAGKLLVLPGATGARGRPSKNRYGADPADCLACPLRARCLKPGEQRRTLAAKDRRATGAPRYKLGQPEARQRDARRKTIVEPVFGQFAVTPDRTLSRCAPTCAPAAARGSARPP